MLYIKCSVLKTGFSCNCYWFPVWLLCKQRCLIISSLLIIPSRNCPGGSDYMFKSQLLSSHIKQQGKLTAHSPGARKSLLATQTVFPWILHGDLSENPSCSVIMSEQKGRKSLTQTSALSFPLPYLIKQRTRFLCSHEEEDRHGYIYVNKKIFLLLCTSQL